ncbi:MAG: hypothetical protein IT204_25765 [Fimbriimonadaceae bacterium]|nr:hypothetical protein [Fimbriimonadaceae bacterium]
MSAVVVDTNVAVVANGAHAGAAAECRLACLDALIASPAQVVVVDSQGLIFREYFRHVSRGGRPGAGDYFAKWLWDRQADPRHCRQVAIHADGESFVEFPDDAALATFDPSDRKFVAVALASGLQPEVLNAVDRDWWEHRAALKEAGVRVRFVCGPPAAR